MLFCHVCRTPPQVLSYLKSQCPMWVKTTTFTSHTRPISHKQRISFTFQNLDGSLLKSMNRERLFDMFGVHERLLQKELLGAIYELTGRDEVNVCLSWFAVISSCFLLPTYKGDIPYARFKISTARR